jgi:hypothetical protein
MGVLFIILIMFLLFLNSNRANYSYRKYGNKCDGFSEESYPVGDGNHFNPNSKNNDYYYDRTGLKGSMFNVLSPTNIYEPLQKIKDPVLTHSDIVYKLELYPDSIYNCTSPSNVHMRKLNKTKYTSSSIPDFLEFNKGIIL